MERAQTTQRTEAAHAPAAGWLVQRKCACGGTPGPDGECAGCRKRRLLGQVGLSIQPKLAVDQPGDKYEREAEQVVERLMLASEPPALSHTGPMVQRSPEEGIPASSPEITPAAELAATPAPAAAEPTPEPATSEPAAETAALIVDDEVRELGPGQLRKSEFLDELRTSICATADAELSRVGQSAQGCPYIERWIGYYRTRTSRHVERALRRYAPEAAGAVSARD